MSKCITESLYVGLDTHKEFTSVAVLEAPGQFREWQISMRSQSAKKLAVRLRKEAGEGLIHCCYEAGPMGYVLKRELEKLDRDLQCDVVAPSRIPRRPGDRVKTDRRDARMLAELLSGGLLTAVRPPTCEEESVRDLCRCREDAMYDHQRARHRLGKFLLRRGYTWAKGKNWSIAHYNWLYTLKLDHAADQRSFDEYLSRVLDTKERHVRLQAAVEKEAEKDPYSEPVGWLRCFKGIETALAMTLVTELHGIERFSSPRQLVSYLGLVPSEITTGNHHRRGAITKAGNRHVRRMLIEAAWSQRHRPIARVEIRRRRRGQPDWVVRVADRAMHRLHSKFMRLHARRVHQNKIVVAVAREMVGFLWAVLTRQAMTEQ